MEDALSATVDMVHGEVVWSTLDYLSKELIRLSEEDRISKLVARAEDTRRQREAEESGTMVTRSGEAALALDAALPPERPLPSGIASSVCRVCRPPRKAGIRLGRRVAGAGGGTASPAPPALSGLICKSRILF